MTIIFQLKSTILCTVMACHLDRHLLLLLQMLVNYHTTQHHIPKDGTLHSHCHGNLKSNTVFQLHWSAFYMQTLTEVNTRNYPQIQQTLTMTHYLHCFIVAVMKLNSEYIHNNFTIFESHNFIVGSLLIKYCNQLNINTTPSLPSVTETWYGIPFNNKCTFYTAIYEYQ